MLLAAGGLTPLEDQPRIEEPRNDPTHAPDLHEYLTEANDLCKSGQA